MKKHLGNQGALDAPILSHGTNQARRGSRKRPDPPLLTNGPGLAITQVGWVRHGQVPNACTCRLVRCATDTQSKRKPRAWRGFRLD